MFNKKEFKSKNKELKVQEKDIQILKKFHKMKAEKEFGIMSKYFKKNCTSKNTGEIPNYINHYSLRYFYSSTKENKILFLTNHSKVIGFMKITQFNKEKQIFRLEYLYLIPEYRGKGIAKEWIEKTLIKPYIDDLVFFISNYEGEDDKVMRIWESLGFKKTSIENVFNQRMVTNSLDLDLPFYDKNTLESFTAEYIKEFGTILEAS